MLPIQLKVHLKVHLKSSAPPEFCALDHARWDAQFVQLEFRTWKFVERMPQKKANTEPLGQIRTVPFILSLSGSMSNHDWK